jgi:hypothetical protein
VAADKAIKHECPLSMIGLMVEEGRIDSVVIKHSWCVPNTTTSSSTSTVAVATAAASSSSSSQHKADWHRCQEDLNNNNAVGSDERGALRDWNEEVNVL